ncbi:MAG: hypothetical protein ACLFSQ_01845 [Candidatus Zixiibacteriota bacterium]
MNYKELLKKAILLSIIALAAFSLLNGCNGDDDDDDDDNGDNTEVLMPLEQGNFWKFAESHFYADSVIVDTDTVLIEIVKDTIIEGDTTWKWIQNNKDEIMFFKNHEDGLYMHAFRNSDSDTLYYYETPRLMFKYPAEIGDEWSGYEIIDTDTLISTPAGDFICYGYRDYDNPMNRRYFFAPGIGYIGTTTYYYDELNRDRKLVEFNIN